MEEQQIKLNGVNFKISEKGDLIPFKESNFSKKRQMLYSWNWFYSNSRNNLFATRYHQISVVKEGKDFIDGVYVNEPMNTHYGKVIWYSQRFKDDKQSINKVNLEIEKLNHI